MKKLIQILLMLILTSNTYSQLIPEYQYDSVRIDDKIKKYDYKINNCETAVIVGSMVVYMGIVQHIIWPNNTNIKKLNCLMITTGLVTIGVGNILRYNYVNKRKYLNLSISPNNLSVFITF
jgi:hypothetical protein